MPMAAVFPGLHWIQEAGRGPQRAGRKKEPAFQHSSSRPKAAKLRYLLILRGEVTAVRMAWLLLISSEWTVGPDSVPVSRHFWIMMWFLSWRCPVLRTPMCSFHWQPTARNWPAGLRSWICPGLQEPCRKSLNTGTFLTLHMQRFIIPGLGSLIPWINRTSAYRRQAPLPASMPEAITPEAYTRLLPMRWFGPVLGWMCSLTPVNRIC